MKERIYGGLSSPENHRIFNIRTEELFWPLAERMISHSKESWKKFQNKSSS